MERKIGEIFEYNGEWFLCIVGNDCEDCAFKKRKCCTVVDNGGPIGDCCADRRKDNKDVIFKKFEKVGEPYEFDGHLFQSYRTFEVPIFTENYATVRPLGNNSKISIELKQNKENMEEKKLNLKPFDIQKAREGKPVCTRDGRKVRIICFDAKRKDEKSIIALVPSKEYLGFEDLIAYPDNGNYYGGHENDGDLMMLPEKKEGWVNVYKSLGVITFSHNPYATKEEAIKDKGNYYVDTIKVEWEE